MQKNPFEALPETVEIDGQPYAINCDFRFGITLEQEVLSDQETDVAGLLRLFYPDGVPRNVNAAVDKMLEFFKAPSSLLPSGKEREKTRKGRWYDFRQDADVLLASFLDAYGIDLSTAKIHWWTFRLLMLNLPHETAFMQRVHYRTADISKVDKKLQPHYRKMRSLFALKDVRDGKAMTVEERDAALKEKIRRRYEEAQQHGRNPS